jgi:hypothetical protein
MLRLGTQSIDLGRLTEDETAELFMTAAEYLREEKLFETLNRILTDKQKLEMVQFNPNELAGLMKDAAKTIPEAKLFEALNEMLTKDQKEQLGETWFNIDRR